MKLACTLIMDVDRNLHTVTSQITWYTSSTLREHAAARILHIFEKGALGGFKTCEDPFIKIKS
jgi:hypothetical protein